MESILTHKALHLLHLALSALLHLFGTKCSFFCARVQEVQSANGARWWFYLGTTSSGTATGTSQSGTSNSWTGGNSTGATNNGASGGTGDSGSSGTASSA